MDDERYEGGMSDEQIDSLAIAIKAGPVYWVFDGNYKRCTCVVKEWFEKYYDGSLADTAEPAVGLEDGNMAALWLSEASDFVKFSPAI
jgi:hypothetical protein